MTKETPLKIMVLLRPNLYTQLFSPAADHALQTLGHLVFHDQERDLTSSELAGHIPAYDVVVTGWGSPEFTPDVLDVAGRLRLVAHTAGSIKRMLPPALFERGTAVTHAAAAIAPAVAEMTLLLILLCLRQVHQLDRILKQGGTWESTKELGMGRELAGQKVGVVGAGYTGRCVIDLLQALGAEVWVADPYLPDEKALALGVSKAGLDDLFAGCPIITLQAPPTQETYRLVGARQLHLLQDGAIFVNTARSHLVDPDALLAELRTGRIQAALDVFDQEPLPEDSPFRELDNVILTPHVAGASRQARLRQGQIVVDEIGRFSTGEPLRYAVTRQMLDTMA